jgi:hypothetical protein
MTAKFVVKDENVTVLFEYTAPTEKVQAAIINAAHYLWDHGHGNHGTEEAPIEFDDLTNMQKLQIVDQHLKRVILDTARTYATNSAQVVARNQAIIDSENDNSLGE